jgi:phosphatidylglycerophosphatase A
VSLAVFLLGHPGPGALLIAGLVVALGGVFVADRAEAVLGRDASEITVDEVAGMLLALSTAPATPVGFLCAFLLFRLFDILKPPPVGALERLKGGLGVVADDLAAGCYAALVLLLPRLLGLRLPWLLGTS